MFERVIVSTNSLILAFFTRQAHVHISFLLISEIRHLCFDVCIVPLIQESKLRGLIPLNCIQSVDEAPNQKRDFVMCITTSVKKGKQVCCVERDMNLSWWSVLFVTWIPLAVCWFVGFAFPSWHLSLSRASSNCHLLVSFTLPSLSHFYTLPTLCSFPRSQFYLAAPDEESLHGWMTDLTDLIMLIRGAEEMLFDAPTSSDYELLQANYKLLLASKSALNEVCMKL